jgi:endonuclease G, mitochondrial
VETYDQQRERQQQEAAQRVVERTPERRDHEATLAGPGGLAAADTPERIAKRLDRLSRYYTGEAAPNGNGTAPDVLVQEALGRVGHLVEADGEPGKVLEKIIGTPDFVGIRYLDAGVAAARAVGRVNIRDAGGRLQGYGTGSLVSPALLLTNHHVLSDAEIARTSVIEFNYQDGIDGRPLQPRVFDLDPDRFFLADEERDFALVAVRATPAELARFGFNRLIEAEGKAIIGEFVTIVQHPGGEKKQIALRENKIVDIPEQFLHYSTDTKPGSSGSPVFNDQWEVVALHHASVPAPDHGELGGFMNEGIRISRILRFLRDQALSPAMRALADEIFAPARVETAAPIALRTGPGVPATPPVAALPTLTLNGATINLPLEITLRVGGDAAPAETEAIAIDPDYSSRRGYDPAFLAVELPLPVPGAALAAVASEELRYHHFSVVMNRERRLAMFTAVNIDGKQSRRPRRENDRWFLDPRLPSDEQTGESVYRDNDLDRGHLVRRLDPAWGASDALAKPANDDTFHFTNATPQHHLFNAGSTLWAGLEDYVLDNADNADVAVSVFTGPVLDGADDAYRGVKLPRQFWKVVGMVTTAGALSVTGYLLSQAALLDDFKTEEEFSYGAYRTFQVPVRRIAELTGLGLDSHIAADPLERHEATLLPRELLRPQDLVL